MYNAAMGPGLRTIFIAALIAAQAGPAFSQKKTPEQLAIEEKQQKAVDDEYKASLFRTRDRAPARVADPWGGVRESVPSQTKSKPASSSAKPAQ
jgi:hypothetical protein